MISGIIVGLAFAHAEEAEADPGLFFEYPAIAGLIVGGIWAARAFWRRRHRRGSSPMGENAADANRVLR